MSICRVSNVARFELMNVGIREFAVSHREPPGGSSVMRFRSGINEYKILGYDVIPDPLTSHRRATCLRMPDEPPGGSRWLTANSISGSSEWAN
jgi:hypothetical protein